MKKNLFYYIASLIVLFTVVGTVSAIDNTWNGGAGPNDVNWTTAANWSLNAVPVMGTSITTGNLVKFYKTTGTAVGTLNGTGNAFQVKVGGPNPPVAGSWSILTIVDGATLNVGEYLMVGIDSSVARSGEVDMTGGTVNLGQINSGNGHLFLGHTISGTTGTLNMSGGTINVTGNFLLARVAGTVGIANLSDTATINTATFQMNPTGSGTASLNILDAAKVVINNDVTGTINTYKSNGWITSEPDDPNDPNGTVMVSYAGGKTTIWAMGSQAKFGSYDEGGTWINNVKVTLQDCNGNDVTFGLTGGGYGEIDSTDCSFSNIILHNTTAKSILTIKTKGKIETSIGDIIVGDTDDANGLKGIVAATTNLQGDITVNGSLRTLTLGDVADDHTITIGEYPDTNNITGVLIKFDRVSDLAINSQLPIKKLTATDWAGGSIDAPSIGSITITGKKTPLVVGDLDVNVVLDSTIKSITVKGTLSGEWTCDSIKSITAPNVSEANITLSQPPDLKILALGKLTAKGTIDSSRILSTGSIGTVSAGKMVDSSCFAGVTEVNDVNAADGVLDLPDPVTDINYAVPQVTIKSIMIKGIKGAADPNSFINSNVAAAQILSGSLYYPKYDNDGIPFGLSAGYIKVFKIIKDATNTRARSWKTLPPNDFTDIGDLKVLHN